MINKSIKYHGVSGKALAVVEHPLLDARQGVYLTTASSRWALARSLEFGGQNTNFYGCFLVTSHSGDRYITKQRSGKSSASAVPVISERGKADLRYALYQAALIASVRNRDFIVYYPDQLRGREREPGIKIKMRVKLAAKLLILAWTLMKKKEPFDPSY